jgi:hypothetical protein
MSSVKEVLNNVDIEETLDKELLLRQSKLLYPEVEEWVLNIAIEAYLNALKQEKEKEKVGDDRMEEVLEEIN